MSRGKRLRRAVLFLLLAAFATLAGYLVVACASFYRPRPADLPCRGCSGEGTAVPVNGFDLYVRSVGTQAGRSPVVILHGGPGHSSDSFKGSLDFLGDLYQVVYYDQRGSGHSQIRPDPSHYTIEELVDELEALRRDVIRADRIILVAHSAGGALALRYALSYGEHVERMILVSSIPINNGVAVPVLWDVFGPALFAVGAGLPPSDPIAANQWFTEVMLDSSAGRLYDPADRSVIEDSGAISFATWREVSRSLEGDDYREALGELETRTLVIYGAADGATTGQAAATRICGQLAVCELVRFERSGHWAFLEEPDRFAEVVRAFLSAP